MELLTDNDNMDIGEKQSYDRLIDGQDIRYKSEYSHDQRLAIASLEAQSKHFKNKNITLSVVNEYLKSFIETGASVNRQSRKELVESLKAKIDFLEKQLNTQQQNNLVK